MSQRNSIVLALLITFFVNADNLVAQDTDRKIEKKICLLVGIDKYKSPKLQAKRLNGCVNDVEAISVELAKFGFPTKGEEGFRILRNEEATRDGILNAFDSTVEEADKNTLVYVHFSCHGKQQPDENGDETDGDGHDEGLVTYDYDTIKDDKAVPLLLDDVVFKRLFQPLIEDKQAYVVVVFDSCHSGDVEKDPFSQARYLDSDADVPRMDGRSMVDTELDAVVITACESKQLAREREVMHNNMTQTMGVLTSRWAKALNEASALKEVSEDPGDQTYRSIIEHIQGELNKSGTNQRPLIKGKRRDFKLFDLENGKPDPYVNAIRTDATVVKLQGGDALGMTEGSVFSLYANDATEFTDGKQIGNVKIFEVNSLDALAAVDGPLKDGLQELPDTSFRVIEKAHVYKEHQFRVLIDQSATTNQVVKLLRPILKEKKQIRVLEKEDGTTFLQIVQNDEGLFLLNDMGRKTGPYTEAAKLQQDILKWCRYRRILDLENLSADANTSVRLELEHKQPLNGRSTGDVFEDEKVEIVLHLTAPVQMYYAILDLKESGRIQVLWAPQNPIAPGTYRPFEAKRPEALPVALAERRSTLKVICSFKPLPFQYLSQEQIRGEISKPLKSLPTDPLSVLLLDNLELTKNFSQPIPKTSWVTDDKPTVVRRRPARSEKK